MSRKIILIKQELLLLVYELNRSGLLAENEKIRPILAQLERSEERFSRNAETDLVCRLLLEKKNGGDGATTGSIVGRVDADDAVTELGDLSGHPLLGLVGAPVRGVELSDHVVRSRIDDVVRALLEQGRVVVRR